MKSLKTSLIILLILISNAHFAYAELSVETKENYKAQIGKAYTNFITKTSSLSPEKRLDKLNSIFDKLKKLKQKEYSEKSTFILDYVYILIENSIKLQQNIINTNTEMTKLFWKDATTNTPTKTIEEQISEAGKTLDKQTSWMAYYWEFNWVKFEYNPNVKINTAGVEIVSSKKQHIVDFINKTIKPVLDKWQINAWETFWLEKLHPRATWVDTAHIAYHRYYASENWKAKLTMFWYWVDPKWNIFVTEEYSNWNKLIIGVSWYGKTVWTEFKVIDWHIWDMPLWETIIKNLQETLFKKWTFWENTKIFWLNEKMYIPDINRFIK